MIDDTDFTYRLRVWAPAPRLEELRLHILAYGAPVKTRIDKHVDLRIFPRDSKKYIAQPLGRLDAVFHDADGLRDWITIFKDKSWTRRRGLTAWCTRTANNASAHYLDENDEGAHRRCCCHLHRPRGECDACDAVRFALSVRRNAREERRRRAYREFRNNRDVWQLCGKQMVFLLLLFLSLMLCSMCYYYYSRVKSRTM